MHHVTVILQVIENQLSTINQQKRKKEVYYLCINRQLRPLFWRLQRIKGTSPS